MIRLESVSKALPNGTIAVHELTIEVGEGEICVLVGPSGCAKTTTPKMITPDAISRALRTSLEDAVGDGAGKTAVGAGVTDDSSSSP